MTFRYSLRLYGPAKQVANAPDEARHLRVIISGHAMIPFGNTLIEDLLVVKGFYRGWS